MADPPGRRRILGRERERKKNKRGERLVGWISRNIYVYLLLLLVSGFGGLGLAQLFDFIFFFSFQRRVWRRGEEIGKRRETLRNQRL